MSQFEHDMAYNTIDFISSLVHKKRIVGLPFVNSLSLKCVAMERVYRRVESKYQTSHPPQSTTNNRHVSNSASATPSDVIAISTKESLHGA